MVMSSFWRKDDEGGVVGVLRSAVINCPGGVGGNKKGCKDLLTGKVFTSPLCCRHSCKRHIWGSRTCDAKSD